MAIRSFWKTWLAGAAIVLIAGLALTMSQRVGAGPEVTVYESPT